MRCALVLAALGCEPEIVLSAKALGLRLRYIGFYSAFALEHVKMIQRGFFISIEGGDACGKSTQVQLLSGLLREHGRNVLTVREPGGTLLGEELRGVVMHARAPVGICGEAELLLFGASRAQLVRELIAPQLADGVIVVCDRFADSTTVYQGCARGLDSEFIAALHRFTVGDCWPDVTIVLDVDDSVSASRRLEREGGQGDTRDRFESESAPFHRAVRDGFLRLAEAHPDRVRVIDGTGSREVVHARVMEVLERAIGTLW